MITEQLHLATEPMREAGLRSAALTGQLHARNAKLRRLPRSRQQYLWTFWKLARAAGEEAAACLREHHRLIHATEKEIRDFGRDPEHTARVLAIANDYLDAAEDEFGEETLLAFVAAYQERYELDIAELWALKPALQKQLLGRIGEGPVYRWRALMSSLRRVGETAWKDFVEAASIVDRILAGDPAGAYSSMDYQSRDMYRAVIAGLAERCVVSEHRVAELAVAFSREAAARSDGSRAATRRTHVGYYLLEAGKERLRKEIGYRPTLRERLSELVLRYPSSFYLGGIEILTLLAVGLLLTGVESIAQLIGALAVLLIPASQAAVDFMNNLTTFLVPPRVLPKLDFSEGIPDDCVTLVAVPSLLLNEAQVRDLVLDLEIRYLANRHQNLYFALLTDSPDSDRPFDEKDALVRICDEAIQSLNGRYGQDGGGPFLMLHRHRSYNESEGRWMGWERKRGKLLDLNRLLRGGFDAFPVKAGDVSVLPRIRYVITLDSDTQLPRDSAVKLIGTIAHPLNRAVVEPVTRMVSEGYGILQPRIGISVQSAGRSRLAALYSGQTGFDIYTRAVSDVYQDLFGEGIFTGKGIYEVDVLLEVLEQRFPDNALLSHDLIEGAYARAALVSDIELIDDYPSHFSAYNRRKHRWVRGDWQIMRWLLDTVPDYHGRTIANPISLVSRWKILDNLRRSLLEPAFFGLLLAGWLFLPETPWYWTVTMLVMLFMPVCSGLVFTALRAPHDRHELLPWFVQTGRDLLRAALVSFLQLVFLLHQALLEADAIIRSVERVFITKRKLLEWETAAEAEARKKRKSTVDSYLSWTPLLSAGLGLVIWFARPQAFTPALLVLSLWFVSLGFSDWLNRPPRAGKSGLRDEDEALVRQSAESICRFFHDWSSEVTNWLIPDNVREDGAVAMRVSPTNIGMLLNARIAAVHLGLMPLEEFVYETQQTLDRVLILQKHRGHLLNWYDAITLLPLEPKFVSTVDSGNLAGSLWTLKQAALDFARGAGAELRESLYAIAQTCDRLVDAMDFGFLYNRRKKVLSVGYNISSDYLLPSCYDLLASESRMATFVAIAKDDIPQEAWFNLGRAHAVVRGEKVLLSWTGTTFEYLMPAIWMRPHPGTITTQSLHAVVRVQREYARRRGVPWGISESACSAAGGDDYGYAPFGIPDLALKPADGRSLVVSPYSSFLALSVDPSAAIRNLRRMQEFEWAGRYGFYEAVDYSRAGGEVIRSWMAHHQGMSLLAACNLLCDAPMQRYFHAEPQVLATELLLHERVPAMVLAHSEPAAAEAVA